MTTAAGTVGAVAISPFVALAAPVALAVGAAGALIWWLARD
ncbi:hypothetical protein [Planktothricoides raciborskii]|uniref:Uncharacterized protein n=1 Tax=Planktothricoides raciborskii GIHE-MW2 TaxID=2792601 RepID=A0AAU8JHS9_9CYAN